VDGHVMIASRGTAAPSRIRCRLCGVPKNGGMWGSHDPIHEAWRTRSSDQPRREVR
jgi:hypothetical protein